MAVELTTKRLLLRPWQESDVDALFELAKDPDVGPDAGWLPHQSIDDSQQVLTTLLMNSYTWAIVLKETGEVIGDISLMPFGTGNHTKNEKEKEIGFWLGKPYWGNGYMPEACLRLMEYAFADLGSTCIWIAHHDKNMKSARVQAKCGFRFDHRKDNIYLKRFDCYRNAIINCMAREDWLKRQEEQANEHH